MCHLPGRGRSVKQKVCWQVVHVEDLRNDDLGFFGVDQKSSLVIGAP